MKVRYLIFFALILLVILASSLYLLAQHRFVSSPATPLPADCQVMNPIGTAPNLQQMAVLENVNEQFGSGISLFSSLTPTPVALPGGCGTVSEP